MMSTPRVMFLYTELAAYSLACFNRAIEEKFELHVVRWPVNNEAPFQFAVNPKISIYERSDYSSKQLCELVESVEPDILIVSGWIDSGYLKVARAFRQSIPVVLTLDNPWRGTLKQQIAASFGRKRLSDAFSHCWVPGKRQFEYARRLGFRADVIERGFYSADLDHFNRLAERTFQRRMQHFPKRFLYVGRYVDFKGVEELWRAFMSFRAESDANWELWCVGTGALYDQRPESEGIRHFGFLQPSELEEVIAQCGVFILPSRKEPWGVVVHEYAAAGFPLICSSEVGAAEAFLREDLNGYLHEPGSEDAIKSAMHKMAKRTDDELVAMAEKSRELAQEISPSTWVQHLTHLIPK